MNYNKTFCSILGFIGLVAVGPVPRAAAADFDVTDHGAVGDGRTLATVAIQRTIDACAAAGGGRVVLPAGTFLSGPVFLKSQVEFHLSPGTVLAGTEDFSAYPIIRGRWEGIERDIHASLITALDAKNVSVTGSGTIDGRGAPWWVAARATRQMRRDRGIEGREPPNPPDAPLAYPRPRVVYLQNCRNVRLSGFTAINSPSWTIHPVYCDDVVIDGLTLLAPDDSPNTDGIDPDSCRNVRISNCRISCGDDAIIMKSGYNEDGRRVGRICENIVISNCVIGSGVAAIGIGSETSGGVRNVTVSNCVFENTEYGLRVKSARGRGAVVENFRASNIVMRNITEIALSITTYYDDRARTPKPADETTPTFRNIEWSNLIIEGTEQVAMIDGLPEQLLEGVNLDRVTVRDAARGISATLVDGLTLSNWNLEVARGPTVDIAQTRELDLTSIKVRRPAPASPVISLTDIAGAHIRGCTATADTAAFLQLSGPDNRDIVLQSNHLAHATQPMALTDGARDDVVTILP